MGSIPAQVTGRGIVAGTLAIEMASLPRSSLDSIRAALTLRRTSYAPMSDEENTTPFYFEEGGWLHVPKGFLFSRQGRKLLAGITLEEGRSAGIPLPSGTSVYLTFGAPPHPKGQPRFIADIEAGCRANRHGGLALAPTRAGKTPCSIEAACKLGGSTLILVDRGPILRQWVKAIRQHVRTGDEARVNVGVVRADSFEYGPKFPFVVATMQTIANRRLPDDFRRAFRTIIVDECQTAPCVSMWGALRRIESRYVLGLTATADRADGLGPAIFWLMGPPIAQLERKLEADVHFLQVPFKARKKDVDEMTGEAKVKLPDLTRFGNIDTIRAEKFLQKDRTRVKRIALEAAKAAKAGRQVLILVGLRRHVANLAAAVWKHEVEPGIFVGGHSSPSEMRKKVVIATFGIAAKGIDFQPPPTLLILAGPKSDVRQAAGRVLQPDAPHRPLILDVVDGHPVLIRQAHRRARFYFEKRFRLRNEVWA